MELTYLTDYAFRVLMYAGAQQQRRVTLSEIAGAYDISKDHLRKVVHRLAGEGYLVTKTGRTGGLQLAREPVAMRLGDIVRSMEESLKIVDCKRQPCRLAGACRLRRALDRARDAFLGELDKLTLQDLLEDAATAGRLSSLVPRDLVQSARL